MSVPRRKVLMGMGAALAALLEVPPTAVAQQAELDVRKFGAVGDGETDDSSAIAAALEAVPDSGGTVYIPPGTYLIPSNRGLSCAKRGVRLVGAGRGAGSVLKYKREPGEPTELLALSSSDLVVEGLTFDGNAVEMAGLTSPLLRISEATRFAVTDCDFLNTSGAGLYLIDVNHGLIAGNHFRDCDYSGVFLALPMTPNSFNDNVWVTDNRLDNCQAAEVGGWAAIQTRAAGNHRRINILNNVITNPGWIGISVDNVSQSLVAGNTITKDDRAQPKGECISFGGSDCLIENNICRNDGISVTACIILYAGASPTSSPPACYNNQIRNNQCTNGAAGIDIVWAQDGLIQGLLVEGNNCYGNTFGLRSMPNTGVSTGGQTAVVVANNVLRGNKVALKMADESNGIAGKVAEFGNKFV